MIWILLIAVIALGYALFNEKTKQKPSTPAYTRTVDEENEDESAGKQGRHKSDIDYSKAYQAKYLLTKNEYYSYKKLKQYADAAGLLICPKVRLLDIIEPRSGENYRTLFAKIKSKHVDFLICDQDLRIKGVVELDDSTHDRNDRQERDNFVDQALRGVGYVVIHTRGITENTLDPITKAGN